MVSGPPSHVFNVFDFCAHAEYERGFVFFGSTGCAPDQHRAGGRGSGQCERGGHLSGWGRCSRHFEECNRKCVSKKGSKKGSCGRGYSLQQCQR